MRNFISSAILLLLPFVMFAHEVRPAYFSITQVTDTTYQVVWKLPAKGTAIPKIYPTLPENWQIMGEQSNLLPGNLRRTYTIKINEGIEGGNLYFAGLDKTLIDVLVSIKMTDGVQYSTMVKPRNPSYTIPTEPNKLGVIKTYTFFGIEHILFGIDHLLFVLALLLITKGFGKLVKTITAFTVAHSITLSLSALGLVTIPIAPAEAVIALSIVFLAKEIMVHKEGHDTLTYKYPWIVAFIFGLLHGFGFASALKATGLPQTEIPFALAFFNIGVELGQLAFVIVVIAFIRLLNSLKVTWPVVLKKAPIYIIGGFACYWFIERILGFW